MAKTYPVIERTGGRVTVLARTAEEAHEAITGELGLGCTIVSVERVRSGGLGGFFATELVRLVAAPKGADLSTADVPSFASAEDLVFALPGGGGQFAARLQEELAALTTKGREAAEASMPRPAPQAAPLAPRPRPEPQVIEADPRSIVTGPVELVSPAPRPTVDDDPTLPEADELHWAIEDDAPRRWRRQRALSTPDLSTEPEPEHRLRDDPVADAALLVAWTEIETAPSAELTAPFDPEPMEYETIGTDPRERSGWDTTRTAPTAYEPLVTGPVDEHRALEQLLAEADLEDQIITPRARLIREGRLRNEGPADDDVAAGALPIDVPLATPASAHDDAPPAPPAELPRPTLPMRTRVLVPNPVSRPTAWSAPSLRAFGVPDGIVDRMAAQRPSDDTEWTVAFMLAVRDLCRPLPNGPSVLTGPSGANLARQLGLVSFSGDELGLSPASVASPNAAPLTLRRALGDRHVHLVVGGNWHHLVTVRPAVVSAATDHDLVEALRVADAWGAALGWTLDGDRYVRIDPFLVAARVRQLLPEPSEPAGPLDPIRFTPQH